MNIQPEWFWGLGFLLLVAWLIFSEETDNETDSIVFVQSQHVCTTALD